MLISMLVILVEKQLMRHIYTLFHRNKIYLLFFIVIKKLRCPILFYTIVCISQLISPFTLILDFKVIINNAFHFIFVCLLEQHEINFLKDEFRCKCESEYSSVNLFQTPYTSIKFRIEA